MRKGRTARQPTKSSRKEAPKAARTLIIPKKGSPLGAKRIKEAIERVFAAKAAAHS